MKGLYVSDYLISSFDMKNEDEVLIKINMINKKIEFY